MANRKVLRIKRTNLQPIAATSSESGLEFGDNEPVDSNEPIIATDDNGTGSENSDSAIDPAVIAGDPDPSDSAPSGKRGRGRPRGSKNGTKASGQKTASNLEAILLSVHNMGACFLHVPELELSKDEAAQLSEAIQRVNELYDVPMLSPTVMAWTQLLFTAGGIYGPRIAAAKIRKTKAAQKPPVVLQPQMTPVNSAPIGVN